MPFAIANSCIACGDCWSACPEGGTIVPGDIYQIDQEACIACGICVDTCPTSSIYEPRRVSEGPVLVGS